VNYQHRPATPADLPAIVDIYNAAVLSRTSTCDLDPVSVESRRAWFDHARHPIWVGHRPDDPGAVTGYLAFEPFLNGRRGYDVTLDLAIYLHPDHRGRGQGGHLLGAAVAHAPRLFRAHGFREWGRLPAVADLDGVSQDVVFVGRTV
jgi:phosphinothricin acetyltransferase